MKSSKIPIRKSGTQRDFKRPYNSDTQIFRTTRYTKDGKVHSITIGPMEEDGAPGAGKPLGISLDPSRYPRDPRHQERGFTGPKDEEDGTPGAWKLLGISLDPSRYPRDPRYQERGLTGPKDEEDGTPETGKMLGISVNPSGYPRNSRHHLRGLTGPNNEEYNQIRKPTGTPGDQPNIPKDLAMKAEKPSLEDMRNNAPIALLWKPEEGKDGKPCNEYPGDNTTFALGWKPVDVKTGKSDQNPQCTVL